MLPSGVWIRTEPGPQPGRGPGSSQPDRLDPVRGNTTDDMIGLQFVDETPQPTHDPRPGLLQFRIRLANGTAPADLNPEQDDALRSSAQTLGQAQDRIQTETVRRVSLRRLNFGRPFPCDHGSRRQGRIAGIQEDKCVRDHQMIKQLERRR